MTTRSLTMLNENGDTTLVWTEESDAKMAEIIRKKMAEGVTFFIITPRFGGLLPAKLTKLRPSDDVTKHRALSIKDEDLALFVDTGAGDAVKTPDVPVTGAELSRDPEKVAKSESVGVKQRQGG